MNTFIELLSRFLRALIGGRSSKQQEVLDQFTDFVEDRMTYLMEQVKRFQEDYIQVSQRLNGLYEELRSLNERLARQATGGAAEAS
ncbi:MAG: hypothetical protein ACOYJE_10420 [Bacteroidaceae bacterium]